jgi:hypothetical protein
MRKTILGLFLVFAIIVTASEYFFGMGFQGMVYVRVMEKEFQVGLIQVSSLSSGGIDSGGLIFNVLRDRGFAVISRASLTQVNLVETFHCEAIEVNPERGEVFVADGTNGVKIFRFFGPNFYRQIQTLQIKGWTNSLAYRDGFLLVGTEIDGIFVFAREADGFQSIQRLYPSGIDKLEGVVTVHSIAATPERFYVAAGRQGVIALEVVEGLLEEIEIIPSKYALDVDISGNTMVVAEPVDNRITLYDTRSLERIGSIELGIQPIEVMITRDWDDNKDYVICRFGDGVSIFETDTFQELFSLKGAFFGIVKPVYGVD